MALAITTFPSLQVSRYKAGKSEVVYHYDTSKGSVARFRAAGLAYDIDNKVNFWKSFCFIGYGDMAEMIKKMSLEPGSFVTIIGEPLYHDLEKLEKGDLETIKKMSSVWYKVLSISYVSGTTAPSRKEKKSFTTKKDPFLKN